MKKLLLAITASVGCVSTLAIDPQEVFVINNLDCHTSEVRVVPTTMANGISYNFSCPTPSPEPTPEPPAIVIPDLYYNYNEVLGRLERSTEYPEGAEIMFILEFYDVEPNPSSRGLTPMRYEFNSEWPWLHENNPAPGYYEAILYAQDYLGNATHRPVVYQVHVP